MSSNNPDTAQITRCLRTSLSLSAIRYASLILLGGAVGDVDEGLEDEDEFFGYRTQPSIYLLRRDGRDELADADGVVSLSLRLLLCTASGAVTPECPAPAVSIFIFTVLSEFVTRFVRFQGFTNRPAFSFHVGVPSCSKNEEASEGWAVSSAMERGCAVVCE